MVVPEEPGDVDLVKTVPSDRDGEPSRGRRLAVVAFALIAVLVVTGAYVFLRPARSDRGEPAATQPADAVRLRREPAALVPLPPLDETDALVRQLVSSLSSHPVIAAWLTTEGLIVNFVVVTSRIADGRTPASELKAVGPISPFRPRGTGDALSIDPSSFRRYDRYAHAVSALDAHGTVRIYETLKPRINEADRNFGGAGQFDAVLERAIVELLKVPVVDGAIALEADGAYYAFADARLEGMSAAQKQLFRMGPENVRAIQSKLREIATVLGIPESRLPPPSSLP